MERKRNLIVAVTGASGSIYARLLCQRLAESDQVGEIALILTDNGRRVVAFEDHQEWIEGPRFTLYDNEDLFSGPASGSASYDSMVVIPCSMGMAGRIASGVSNDLISRAADVMLKERRRLILVPREVPLSTLHLRNLTLLSEAGALICPASPSFYTKPSSMETLCGAFADRIAALLGIDGEYFDWRISGPRKG